MATATTRAAAPTLPGSDHLGRRHDLLRRRARRRLDRHRLPRPPGRRHRLAEDHAEGARRRRGAQLRAARRRPQPRRAAPRGLRPRPARALRPLLLRAAHGLRVARRRAGPERHADAHRRQGRPRPRRAPPRHPRRRHRGARLGRHAAGRRPRPARPQAGRHHRRRTPGAASRASAPRTPTAPSSSPSTCSAHGRTRLLFVGDPGAAPDINERYAGFVAAHRARGLEPAEPVRVPFREGEGEAVAERILAGEFDADALVCANDELALAVMTRLQDAGRDVPGDIAVVGWDDVMTSRYVRPGLTTVRQPVHELGVLAAERLHQRVSGGQPRAGAASPADRGRAPRLLRLRPTRRPPVPGTRDPTRLPTQPSENTRESETPMRRTTAITVACMTAAALTVTACGRSADNGGPPPARPAPPSAAARPPGTITVWAMGAEGDNLSEADQGLRGRQPRRQGPGHRHPVGCRARQVHDRHHRRQDAGRRHGRHDVDG